MAKKSHERFSTGEVARSMFTFAYKFKSATVPSERGVFENWTAKSNKGKRKK